MANESFFQMPEDEAKALLNALANTMKMTFGTLQIAIEQIGEACEGIGDAHDAWRLETLLKLVYVLKEQRMTEPSQDL